MAIGKPWMIQYLTLPSCDDFPQLLISLYSLGIILSFPCICGNILLEELASKKKKKEKRKIGEEGKKLPDMNNSQIKNCS